MERWRLAMESGRGAGRFPFEKSTRAFRLAKVQRPLRWPAAPTAAVRVWDLEGWPGYSVDVEFVEDAAGEPVVTGVAVRRDFEMREKEVLRSFDEERWEFAPVDEVDPVSTRDMRRMPLDTIVAAATVAVTEDATERRYEELRKAFASRSRRGRAARPLSFWREVRDVARQAQRDGRSPAEAIVEKYGGSRNRADQWLHTLRHDLGLLEKPPQRRQGGLGHGTRPHS